MRRALLVPGQQRTELKPVRGARKSGHLGQRAPSGEPSACCGHADALAHAPVPLPSLAPSFPPHLRALRKQLQMEFLPLLSKLWGDWLLACRLSELSRGYLLFGDKNCHLRDLSW